MLWKGIIKQKTHHKFKEGIMSKNDKVRNHYIKKVMILYPDLVVTSSEDYNHLINIHNTAEFLYGKDFNLNLVKNAFKNKSSMSKLASKNDYFYLLFKSREFPSDIKKYAYPTFEDATLPDEFDINKWAELVYKIYDDAGTGKMDMHDAIDYYSKQLDTKAGEDRSFKRWVKYFQSGEHLKYSKRNSLAKQALDKKAIFSISPPSNPYATNAITPSLVFQEAQEKVDNKQSEDQISKSNKDNYEKWMVSLNKSIRSADNLLRKSYSHLTPQLRQKLLDLLHNFSREVISLETKATASDLAFKYADRFKKLGFDSGYKEFIKYAQQADSAPPVEGAPAAAPATAAPTGATPTAPPPSEVPAAPPGASAEGAPTPSQAVPTEGATPLERALEKPDEKIKDDEYSSLAGEVGLEDAVSKLEDIASRLSDRRTIRLLAEFDIILDKIGIAPMFPELAEAQSKLIDSYSYALTRVTKMLGMLSSGKSVFEISDSKKKELIGKTLKELNRGAAIGEEFAGGGASEPAEGGRTPEETQAGIEEAGLAQGTPTGSPLPEGEATAPPVTPAAPTAPATSGV